MGIFKRETPERFDEDRLREFYLDKKKIEKNSALIISIGASILAIALSVMFISKSIFWALIFPILLVLLVIHNLNKFCTLLEDIFENRLMENGE